MNLGIIGSGMIVKDFLSFAHELPGIKLEAIAARNIENLKEFYNKVAKNTNDEVVTKTLFSPSKVNVIPKGLAQLPISNISILCLSTR